MIGAVRYVLITANADYIQNSAGTISPMPIAGLYTAWLRLQKIVREGSHGISPRAIFHSFYSLREASVYWQQVFGDAPLPTQDGTSMERT